MSIMGVYPQFFPQNQKTPHPFTKEVPPPPPRPPNTHRNQFKLILFCYFLIIFFWLWKNYLNIHSKNWSAENSYSSASFSRRATEK